MLPTRITRLVAGAAVALLVSCSPPPREQVASTLKPPVAHQPKALAPLPAPVLNRAQFLSAVGEAASAFATGAPELRAAADLAGRRFSIRLPFGCDGPSQDNPGYSYDVEAETLRVTAKPQQWARDPMIKSLLGAADAEAIEGFWIARPWILVPSCPAVTAELGALVAESASISKMGQVATAPGPQPQAPALEAQVEGNSVALATVFEKDGSRLLRRGTRPYEVVRKGAPPEGGFQLVLEGRFSPADGRGAVRCAAQDLNHRPVCLAKVEFDRVAIEAGDGDVLGEWRN